MQVRETYVRRFHGARYMQDTRDKGSNFKSKDIVLRNCEKESRLTSREKVPFQIQVL